MNINLTLLAQAITFAIFIWFTARFVWPPLLGAIEARRKTIADGLAAAERGQQEQHLAQKRATELLHEAHEKAKGVLSQADARATEIVEAAKLQGKTEGDRQLAAAQAEIGQLEHRLREQLRAQVGQLAVAAAAQILGREVKVEDHNALLADLSAKL